MRLGRYAPIYLAAWRGQEAELLALTEAALPSAAAIL